MDLQQKELFRLAALRVFAANKTRFGLELPALKHLVAAFGFTPGDADLADAVAYLERKGFVEEVLKALSPENRAWRVTAAAIAFLDERS
jgi:hypothetical protein